MLERSEFFESMGDTPSSQKLSKAADLLAEKISEIILDAMIQFDSTLMDSAFSHYSEMYDDDLECDTLGKTIARFCVEWGLGKDPEMLEALDDLEEEIAIVFEEVKEEREEEDELS